MTTDKVFRCLARCFDVLVWFSLVLIVAVCVTSTESARRNQVRFSDDVIVFPKEESGGVEKRSENGEYRMPGIFRHTEEFHQMHPELPNRRKGHSDRNGIRENSGVYNFGDEKRKFFDYLDTPAQNITVQITEHIYKRSAKPVQNDGNTNDISIAAILVGLENHLSGKFELMKQYFPLVFMWPNTSDLIEC